MRNIYMSMFKNLINRFMWSHALLANAENGYWYARLRKWQKNIFNIKCLELPWDVFTVSAFCPTIPTVYKLNPYAMMIEAATNSWNSSDCFSSMLSFWLSSGGTELSRIFHPPTPIVVVWVGGKTVALFTINKFVRSFVVLILLLLLRLSSPSQSTWFQHNCGQHLAEVRRGMWFYWGAVLHYFPRDDGSI